MHTADLLSCESEPIHIPGAIQPHGLLLVADAASLDVVGGAGAIEKRLVSDWSGEPLSRLLGQDVAGQVAASPPDVRTLPLEARVAGRSEYFDAVMHRAGSHLLVELEPSPGPPTGAMQMLARLDGMARAFEQASSMAELCQRAAKAIRAITGFDRVMIYQFIDDAAGRVLAEDRDPSLESFLHHHFPGSDIPRQARALYLRNRARSIPTVDYQPAPLRPVSLGSIDLSDVGLRSVSPVHLQYLRNMGVASSASFSIVRDSSLWGLVACHHRTPFAISRETSIAASALANALSRQIAAREQHLAYETRLRLRAAVDELAGSFEDDRALDVILSETGENLRRIFEADAFVYVADDHLQQHGVVPLPEEIGTLAAWVREKAGGAAFSTHTLSQLYPPAAAWPELASGVLAVPLAEQGCMLLWLRVERVEEVRWAGEPHKLHQSGADIPLSPRRSFASWAETVRARARSWSIEEIDAARRLARRLDEARNHRRIRALNRELRVTLDERDALLAQKDLLMREVDHRVQNSLQMVTSYLMLQARDAGPGPLADRLAEAQARLSAVGLVHRRLYRADHPASLELGDYLADLLGDLRQALGKEWAPLLTERLAAILVPTDRAVPIGLVMTELVINAVKYAYDGRPGPIQVVLERHGAEFRMTVSDRGKGRDTSGTVEGSGFGSRMIAATVRRLGGSLEEMEGSPGLRTTLTAQIAK